MIEEIQASYCRFFCRHARNRLPRVHSFSHLQLFANFTYDGAFQDGQSEAKTTV
jgi:hypothetical protein